MEHASKEIEKEKIRNRYKGVSPDLLEVIPAEERVDILQDDREKRVGVYVRVSTDDPRQTSSFELQRNHYTDLIDRYPNWHLYRIYADEGISGTSLKHRKSFIKMIEDCKQHKLDLIVTKSVSRFARNIYDCIGYIRMLAALKPPVPCVRHVCAVSNAQISFGFSHLLRQIMEAFIVLRLSDCSVFQKHVEHGSCFGSS